jgi:hypothetical protein
MAGRNIVNQVQLGDSSTATQNFTLETLVNGQARLARGNAGATTQDVLTVDSNGIVAAPAGRNFLTLGTAQNTTSGTNIDFTGIPSWAKRITVMFNGVSTNYAGSANIVMQLGTSGGIQATGYVGSGGYYANAAASAVSTWTTGLTVFNTAASNTLHGSAVFNLLDAGTGLWVGSYTLGRGDALGVHSGGTSKTLSGTLDRIRITTTNGTDTFDAGSVNILIEG